VAAKPAAEESPAYVITIVGLVQRGKYHAPAGAAALQGSRDGQRLAASDPKEVLEAFMQYSRLRARGGFDLRPDNVKLDPATGAVHIFFPRARPLGRHQKEVLFTTHLGSLNVSTKFRLGSMTSRGQLEL
jgi:hypothetical protein